MTTSSERTTPTSAPPGEAIALVGTLCTIYMVSMFLRNSVAVIAPDLAREFSLAAADIGLLASAFFFSFAAVQLPLGVALDRYGPRLCMLVCAALVVVGTIMFAAAAGLQGLVAGRIVLGLGCSCFMVAPFALYAQKFAPEPFATIVGVQIGLGSLGALLATAPLAFSAAAIGWRMTFLLVTGVTLLASMLVWLIVRDAPAQSTASHRETFRESLAGLREVFRVKSLVPLFLMHSVSYSTFVFIVGLWGGPYLSDVYGYGLQARGDVLLAAAVAQAVGMFVWGPTNRLLGGHKLPVLIGGGLTCASLAWLAIAGPLTPGGLIAWMAIFGLVTAYVPVLIAHGKTLFPPHLVGRGLTVLNIGSMGGIFLTQVASGAVLDLFPSVGGVYPVDGYRTIFGLQGALVLGCCLAYASAHDPARDHPNPMNKHDF